ncbi:hypothetical protein FQR65_LT01835 [Abscondita terminalis]|nr:hypothetical protein FQR65_LT01835 [Abscondita terminalis]
MFGFYYLSVSVLTYLVFYADRGDCVLCYSCDSKHNDYCEDPFNFTAFEPSNCTNDNFACLKREKYDRGNAKLCYSCTTLKNNKCNDPFNLPLSETVTCNETGYGCMKQILPATGSSPRVIHRGCTPKFYCTTLSSASEHCTVCDTGLCNSSSILIIINDILPTDSQILNVPV